MPPRRRPYFLPARGGKQRGGKRRGGRIRIVARYLTPDQQVRIMRKKWKKSKKKT